MMSPTLSDHPQTAPSPALRSSGEAPRMDAAAKEDAALVVAAMAGDRAAMGALHRRYARMVHGIALSYVEPARAEDICQDVFAHAIGRLESLREPAAFGGWLARIARNRAVDAVRRRREAELDEAQLSHAGNAHASAEAREVMRHIRSLPDTYRESLVMRLVEGMTGPEIAARTGLTPASVRVNLYRGMRMLKARLRGDEEEAS